MLLLELTTLTHSARARKLGMTVEEDDLIEVRTSINIESITHLSEHPEDKRLTNIYLTSGNYVTSPSSFSDIQDLLKSDDEDYTDQSNLPFNNEHVKYKL